MTEVKRSVSRRKIIYFITKSVWGGAAKYIVDLAEGLDKESYEIFIAAGPSAKLGTSGEGSLKEKAQKIGAVYLNIPHFGREVKFISDILSFFEVLYMLWEIQPDIIHVNSSKAGGVCGIAGFLYKFTGKKLLMVFTVHGWGFHESRPHWQLFIIKFLSWLTGIFYQKIICISKTDYNFAPAPKRKLALIFNGISADINFFPKEEARLKLSLGQNDVVIGTIGEWIRNKGWDILIKAKPEYTTLVLIAGGETPEREKITDEKTKIIENLPEAARYLKAFDVFVFPSRKEGLPYALLEAGLAELPSVASAVGGNLDVVENGKTGLLVPPENPEELRNAIEKLLENQELRKQFGQSAREKVLREFSIKKMREESYKLYA